jgi:hypothetical protein
MAYSDFTLKTACRTFDLVLDDEADLHADVPEVEIGPPLRASLEEHYPLAVAIHTEKARSELIVAPILLEVRRRGRHRISFFSGVDFDVDPERGLNGVCDFLLARSTVQLYIESPVLAVVEAKSDNIKAGLGQCVAEMVAARIFNEREGRGPTTIHGAVTTGSLWRFLRLEGSSLQVDEVEYPFDRLEKVLGILLHCVGEGSS